MPADPAAARAVPATGGDDRPPRTVASSDGITLAVHDLGGSGPPVLLAHATGFHGRVWQPCADHLPYHCFALDFRGHGDSPLPGQAEGTFDPDLLDWDGFGDDVLAVAAALAEETDGGPLRGVGHSKGAAALLLAEQRRPGTFASLYLYEPIAFPPEVVALRVGNPLAAGARRRRARFASFAEAEANFAAKRPLSALDPAALHAYVRFGFAPDPDGGVALKCPPEVEAEVYQRGMRHQAAAHLDAVGCPTTVVGGGDGGMPARLAPAIAAGLPHGRLAHHPLLGHFGPLEDPAAVAYDIATHLPR
jgi:pimeloyl-ACP methyl ester carboxylesterase